LDWSSTNDYLLSCSIDKTLRVWEIKSKRCIRSIDTSSAVFCCCFHPVNNNILAAATASSTIEFFNFSTGKEMSTIRIDAPAKCISFSTDGLWLYSGCADGKVRWFKCTNVTLFTNFTFEGSANAVNAGRAINSLSYRDLHCLAVGDLPTTTPALLINAVDSTVRLFRVYPELENDKCLVPWAVCPIVNKSFTIRSSFSPMLSNRRDACFASGSEDGILYIYDYPVDPPTQGLAKSRNVNMLQGHSYPVLDVAWNADETLLVSVDAGGVVIAWKRIKEVSHRKI